MAAKSTKSVSAPAAPAAAAPEKSKAQIVQEYKANNPEATPKAIAEALAKQGVEINAPHVSSILSHARGGSGSKGSNIEKFKEQIRLAGAFAKQHGDIKKALAAIESVGGFIDACGSSENAKAALAAYKEMAESLG